LLRKREAVTRGGAFDRWDLQIRGGLLGSVRALGTIEEHGAGKQLFRLRAWPYIPIPLIVLITITGLVSVVAAYDHAWIAAFSLGATALVILLMARAECGKAMEVWRSVINEYAGHK
jgi:hypothetical protein